MIKKWFVEIFVKFCIITIFMTCIILAWEGLELLFDGAIHKSRADSIIGTILVFSLWKNMRLKITYSEDNGNEEKEK